jgi:prolyl 4-hydroxylase
MSIFMSIRGEKVLDPKIQSQLRCRYVHRGEPFLKLQPAKEEEAYLSPRIVVYHDVLFENEITTITKLAQPRVKYSNYLVNSI